MYIDNPWIKNFIGSAFKLYCLTSFRHALIKFRLPVHKLVIETGGHNGIDRHLRKCQICSLNKIEDEYHFLLECPK